MPPADAYQELDWAVFFDAIRATMDEMELTGGIGPYRLSPVISNSIVNGRDVCRFSKQTLCNDPISARVCIASYINRRISKDYHFRTYAAAMEAFWLGNFDLDEGWELFRALTESNITLLENE